MSVRIPVTKLGQAAQAQVRAALPAPEPKRTKYGAKRTELDGRMFDSKAEARHFAHLKQQQRSGMITNLICQPTFAITVNGIKIGSYKADFEYHDAGGERRVVDVKGGKATQTPLWRWKVKLVWALYGVRIEVVE